MKIEYRIIDRSVAPDAGVATTPGRIKPPVLRCKSCRVEGHDEAFGWGFVVTCGRDDCCLDFSIVYRTKAALIEDEDGEMFVLERRS